MRSGEFKERLNSFTQDFTWIRGHVLEIVHIQSAININSMNINIQRIIETLGRDGAKESAATRMVESRGGPEAVLEVSSLVQQHTCNEILTVWISERSITCRDC